MFVEHEVTVILQDLVNRTVDPGVFHACIVASSCILITRVPDWIRYSQPVYDKRVAAVDWGLLGLARSTLLKHVRCQQAAYTCTSVRDRSARGSGSVVLE